MIATDGSELADKALTHGLALAKTVGAMVTIVTVTEMWSAMGMLRESHGEPGPVTNPIIEYEKMAAASAARIPDAASQKAKALGISCTVAHVADQHPAEGIVALAVEKDCDLIVMASHGRRGIERLILGSQAYEALSHTKVPTLIVR